MKKPIGDYIFFIVGFLLCGLFALLPIGLRVSTFTYLVGLGVAVFGVLVSLVIVTVTQELHNWWLITKLGVALLMLFIGRFTSSLWSASSVYTFIWILLSGFLLFEYHDVKQASFNVILIVVAFVFAFFPNMQWLAYLIVAVDGLIYCFTGPNTTNRFLAFAISTMALAVAVSFLPRYGGIRFGTFIPMVALAYGCLQPQILALREIKKRNDDFNAGEQRLAAIEEKALKEEIRPHFLLNALNNVRVAYRESIDSGREMLNELIQLESLVDSVSDKEMIPIKKEVEIIQGLVRLFSLERKKDIRLDVELEDPDCMIPPMLLEPLVENSLQHSGIVAQDDGYIAVIEKERFGFIVIQVVDNGTAAPASSPSRGIGLSNVQRRINLFDRGNLIITNSDEGVSVSISIPIQNR